MIKGFTCGSFDLFHAGHIGGFEEYKKMCDYLIVGVQTDPSIDRPKDKHKPIQSIVERQFQVKACRYVDEVIVYETEKELEEILMLLDIQKRFVGIDHLNGYMIGESICKERGIEIVYKSRAREFSTSNLRERIEK